MRVRAKKENRKKIEGSAGAIPNVQAAASRPEGAAEGAAANGPELKSAAAAGQGPETNAAAAERPEGPELNSVAVVGQGSETNNAAAERPEGPEFQAAVLAEAERIRAAEREEEELQRQKKKERRQRQEIRLFFRRLILLVLVVFLLFGVLFGIAVMPDDSMAPKIGAGDLLFYYRLDKELASQDVVVFEKEGSTMAGRVAAVPGDTVDISDEYGLMVNGSIVYESGIYYTTRQYEGGIDFPVTLGEDEYFILCDYREGAKDSRYFGPVSLSEIKGTVITVLRRTDI